MAEMTGELAALLARSREFAEREYQAGVESANRRIKTAGNATTSGDPEYWLTRAIRVADYTIGGRESTEIQPAWSMRGYRDTLVEYRDSMADR